MKSVKSRDIATHFQVLATVIAAGTLLASFGMLAGVLILMPAVLLFPDVDAAVRQPAETILLGIGSATLLFALANLVLGLSAAFGLYRRRPWGRALAIVDSVLSLFFFPVGTLVGAYGLWVLIPDDAAEYVGCCVEKPLKPA